MFTSLTYAFDHVLSLNITDLKYKEKMSFEQADKIILEGMGTQFDKRLEKYYLSACPKFEEYYSSLQDE